VAREQGGQTHATAPKGRYGGDARPTSQQAQAMSEVHPLRGWHEVAYMRFASVYRVWRSLGDL
jgi:hypothetical protein